MGGTQVKELDPIYLQLLRTGLLSLRDAALRNDLPACQAEAECLHEVPTLVGEDNIQRHFHYARVVFRSYIEWARATGRSDVNERVNAFYVPIWKAIADVLSAWAAQQEASRGANTAT